MEFPPDDRPAHIPADRYRLQWQRIVQACQKTSGFTAHTDADVQGLITLTNRIVEDGDGVPVAIEGSRHLHALLRGRPDAQAWVRKEFTDAFRTVPVVVQQVIESAVNGTIIDDGLGLNTVRLRCEVLEYERPQALAGVLTLLGKLVILTTLSGKAAHSPQQWAPDPRRLPDWRHKLIKQYRTPTAAEWMAQMLASGVFRDAPIPVADHPEDVAQLLLAQEARHLAEARLYYADSVQSGIAARKAHRPRTTPLAAHRVPAPCGFLVFEQGIPHPESGILISAASWSRWTPTNGPAAGWEIETPDGPVDFAEGTEGAWWVTLYTAPTTTTSATLPLVWFYHRVIPDNTRFPQAPDPKASLDTAVRTVIASWDLITQGQVAKPVVDITELRRRPKDLRADRRRGISDDGRVRLVTIKPRKSVPQARPGSDGEHDDQGTKRVYRHRWHVSEHDRDHCMNPRLHAQGGCRHENITIVDYVKGPEGAPWSDTVNLLKGTS
ncbi:hypothetical protein ACH4FX_37525 [Streptomyces sp. NPDC018019]|uniref:hypothetical protein n=1 Tax=Streptomyces sp. NPDC018019 TaxID=3365030 RepID=UPI0037B58F2F